MISTFVIAKTFMDENEALKAENDRLLQKMQQLERYAKGTLCIECMYHTSWENENWDIVHWCKAHAEQVTEDDFCSIGEHR